MPIQWTPSEGRVVQRLLARAWNAEANGNLLEAERVSNYILEQYPAHAEARLVQARVWARTGRVSCAIEAFRDLLARNPDFDAARLALIGALFLTNAYNEGLDHLQHVARRCVEEKLPTPPADRAIASLWSSYTDRKES